jgi:hypothetical protein
MIVIVTSISIIVSGTSAWSCERFGFPFGVEGKFKLPGIPLIISVLLDCVPKGRAQLVMSQGN